MQLVMSLGKMFSLEENHSQAAYNSTCGYSTSHEDTRNYVADICATDAINFRNAQEGISARSTFNF
jgi:hypothetical protein